MTNPVRSLRLQPSTRRWVAVGLLVVVWLTQSLQLALAAGSALPIQPDSLTAGHRSGQTFLTWRERADLTAERYRIYRHSAPISAANLAEAHLLAEIGEGSATFFAGRYQDYATPPNWAYRYSERLIIEDDGTTLNGDTGLLVWTLAIADFAGAVSGAGYYAVTTVADGVENQSDFGPGNTLGPVAEAVALPQPVRIQQNANGWQVYLQYMDLRNWNATFHAPNPLNGYYGLSSTSPGVPSALQFAYDYALYVPDAARCGGELPASLPLFVNLHAWGGNTYGPFTGAAGPWCAYILAPVDQSETWWFGFARDKDYRQGGQPATGDVIVNYTEQRLLQMIDFVLRQPPGPPADANRVYVSGHSMGGGGALALAMRYPQVFAAANASKPVTDHRTTGWTFSTVPRWGDIATNLPVVVAAPNGWADALQPYAGVGIWDWQNFIRDLAVRGHAPMTPLGLDFGINDIALPWSAQGEPFFSPLDASRQSWGAIVGEDGHNWGAYQGLPPNLRLDSANVPFAGLRVVRNESTPGFSQASADPSLPPTAAGRFHHTLLWSAAWLPWDGAPLDMPHQWQVSLCAVAVDATTCGGETQQVTVTPRRLQHFAPVAGTAYTWENWSISAGAVAARGVITADVDGLLTTPPVIVDPTGNRLLLLEGAAPTAVETFTASVVGGVVTLDWSTVAETPGTLFHIQRAAAVDGPYTRVNATALPATGAPGNYTFTDHPSSGIYYYRLEDIDGVGNSRLRGPVRVVCTTMTITVQSAADDGTANAANCPGPNCRLRDAIAAAATDDAINFGGNFSITLVSQLMIDKNLTIDGVGHAVTVSGNHITRVFNVTAGHVTFDTLTITDGNAQTLDCFFPSLQCGGGIMIQNIGSVVTVTHSTLSGNSAQDIGGSIFNSRGLLTVKDSTLSGNSATYGGGIANDWTLVVQNSTFASNSALEGGGIYNSYGPLTMTHSTIAGNSATSSGGGILNYAGVLNLSHTLIANSPAGGDCYNQSGGSVVANDHNLIEATGLEACDLSNGNGGSFIGVDPLLGPLGNYGGSTQTFALLAGSPAIDAGNPASCLPIDQRGEARDDLRCDIGAYELKYADSPTVIRSVSSVTMTTFGSALIGIQRNASQTAPGVITVTKSLTWKTKPANAINAYWSITPTVNSGLNLTLTLCYTPTESNGLDLSALRFWRFSAGAWNSVPGTPVTSTVGLNSCATLAGVNELSIWTLATSRPTAVTLTALSAHTALDAERRLELALLLLSLVFLVSSGGWWLWRRKLAL